ncbi:MAG: hypothetical protein AB7D07_04925 [Desulfovibrionaceae bacterium]|jgi:hypothetical protein
MFNKKIFLTKAGGFIFGLATVLVFAASSWAARVDVDNQSSCDVEVTYTVDSTLADDPSLTLKVPAGKTGYRDDAIYWTCPLKYDVKVWSGDTCIKGSGVYSYTYYHCKVTCTGKDVKSLRCDIKFSK